MPNAVENKKEFLESIIAKKSSDNQERTNPN
jgi:hypothetical protein